MEITYGDIWVGKDTGVRVLVLRVKDYMVTFQKDGIINTMGDFEFRDNYKKEVSYD